MNELQTAMHDVARKFFLVPSHSDTYQPTNFKGYYRIRQLIPGQPELSEVFIVENKAVVWNSDILLPAPNDIESVTKAITERLSAAMLPEDWVGEFKTFGEPEYQKDGIVWLHYGIMVWHEE